MKKKIIAGIILCLVIGLVTGIILWKNKDGEERVSTAPVPQISAGQAILIDGKTGEVLYEKNATERAYPASTTKIMTALLTLETLEEYNSPLDQMVTVPPEAIGVEGSSLYLKPGEKISIQDLMYGMMLHSGNDSAVALAVIASGDRQAFVDRMNERAAELGCNDTNFLNPNGLYDDNHYTTAKDMAAITREALSHKEFRKIVSARSWDAKRTTNVFNHFYNKNKTVHQFKGAIGVKIGYTKASGRTLVAAANRDGKEVICVVMRAPNWFNDAYALMEYGFKELDD